MDKRKLDAVIKAGKEKALLEAAGSKLWSAKCCCDRASQEGFKDFLSQVTEARAALDDAEQLWRETYNL